MHNLDRTQLEYETGENEQFLGDIIGAFTGGELEVPLNESQELELASELLEVANEQELEQFLGNVFGTVGNAVGQFVRSDTGRALGGILKDAARQALPVVGRAVGDWVAPGSGGAAGASIAQQAGSLLGLELEGLSPQDQEFEAARQFVRFAGAATKNATAAPRNVAPHTAARAAAVAAAQHHAPGLARAIAQPHAVPRPPHVAARTPHRPAVTPQAAAHARAAAAHARAAASHAARASGRPQPPHHAAVGTPRTPGFYRPPHAAAATPHRHHHHHRHHHVPGAPAGYQRRPDQGQPWYWRYPRYRYGGYAGAAPSWSPAPAWSPPPAYAPAYTAPAPVASAPVTGNGWVPQRGQRGTWERRGSVLVIYGA
jgi:hypothetical protein